MGLTVLTNIFVYEHQKGILHLRFENSITVKCIFYHVFECLQHLK